MASLELRCDLGMSVRAAAGQVNFQRFRAYGDRFSRTVVLRKDITLRIPMFVIRTTRTRQGK